MKVAIIYNKDLSNVINRFGMQNREVYNDKTVNRVAKALESHGHNVEIIDGNMNVIDSIQAFMPKVLDGEKMGMVFNMAYGIQGESRYTHIPSMLEMIGIPYVGSNPSGHALALDKVITKIVMQKHSIATPQFWVFSNLDEDMSNVVYPVIIKPKMEAVSFGLKIVNNQNDLKTAVEFILNEYHQQALVEQFIPGREFAVGLIGNQPTEAFPVLEIDLENDPNAIQTVEDKKEKPRSKICPAHLPEKLANLLQQESIRAFKALQLYDFARVDIRMDSDHHFYLLEINSMASLGLTGSYPFAAKAAGLEFDELVNRMLDVAVKRYFGQNFTSSKALISFPEENNHLKIKSYLRNRQPRYLEMLKTFVNTNTYVRNLEGVNRLSTMIKKNLNSLGFSFQRIQQAEIGNMFFFTNSEDEEFDILLLGNIDNAVRIEEHRYFHETEQRYFGTGVWQNKGGLVVMIAALQALKNCKILGKCRIGVLLTTDSSIKNKVSASIIRQKALQSNSVIGLTGSFLEGGLVTSRSGAATYNISLNLINNESTSHVTRMTTLFTKLCSTLCNLSNQEQGILVTPAHLEFNSNILNVSAHGKMSISVRFKHPEQLKAIETKIDKLLPQRKALIDSYIAIGNQRPVMERSENVASLWKTYKAIADRLDIRLREEHRWSSSDINFVSNEKQKIDGAGPVGTQDEKKQEYILKYSLIERSALLAAVIAKLGRMALR